MLPNHRSLSWPHYENSIIHASPGLIPLLSFSLSHLDFLTFYDMFIVFFTPLEWKLHNSTHLVYFVHCYLPITLEHCPAHNSHGKAIPSHPLLLSQSFKAQTRPTSSMQPSSSLQPSLSICVQRDKAAEDGNHALNFYSFSLDLGVEQGFARLRGQKLPE